MYIANVHNSLLLHSALTKLTVLITITPKYQPKTYLSKEKGSKDIIKYNLITIP